MKRLLAGVVVMSVAVALPFADCGGLIYGYLDDAGVYHAGDGAVLFVPGSACVGFDAAHVADPSPLCGLDADTDEAGVCATWPSIPPRFPFLDTSACTSDVEACDRTPCADAGIDGGTFHCIGGYDSAKIVACPSADTIGDTFCTAYAQQFVVVGQAVGVCDWNKATLEHPDAAPNICF
ncbi:MAG TPA: hypothetical protein VGH87_04720, partial [Polyangiaceae bacterium]